MKSVENDLLNAVNEFLSERVGLYFSEMRISDLERGLHKAAGELDYANVNNCINDLLGNCFSRLQMQILVRNLTIGETYFFRDPAVFLALEDKILPELIKRKRGRKVLRIWSAGCSTGEEPYSIAISILRTIRDFDRWNLSLLATDLNTHSIEKARKGAYSPWSFRTMPEDFIPLFFDKMQEDGQFSLKESVRNLVTFSYLNLAEDNFPSLSSNTNDIDIIFCRNVLIYFTQQKCKEIGDKLSASLNPGGILITSANDSTRFITATPNGLERINATMFRKLT